VICNLIALFAQIPLLYLKGSTREFRPMSSFRDKHFKARQLSPYKSLGKQSGLLARDEPNFCQNSRQTFPTVTRNTFLSEKSSSLVADFNNGESALFEFSGRRVLRMYKYWLELQVVQHAHFLGDWSK